MTLLEKGRETHRKKPTAISRDETVTCLILDNGKSYSKNPHERYCQHIGVLESGSVSMTAMFHAGNGYIRS